jgi:hypothetical protein
MLMLVWCDVVLITIDVVCCDVRYEKEGIKQHNHQCCCGCGCGSSVVLIVYVQIVSVVTNNVQDTMA